MQSVYMLSCLVKSNCEGVRACRTQGTNIEAFSLHPGSITTNLGRHLGVIVNLAFLIKPFLKNVEQVVQCFVQVCIAVVFHQSKHPCDLQVKLLLMMCAAIPYATNNQCDSGLYFAVDHSTQTVAASM